MRSTTKSRRTHLFCCEAVEEIPVYTEAAWKSGDYENVAATIFVRKGRMDTQHLSDLPFKVKLLSDSHKGEYKLKFRGSSDSSAPSRAVFSGRIRKNKRDRVDKPPLVMPREGKVSGSRNSDVSSTIKTITKESTAKETVNKKPVKGSKSKCCSRRNPSASGSSSSKAEEVARDAMVIAAVAHHTSSNSSSSSNSSTTKDEPKASRQSSSKLSTDPISSPRTHHGAFSLCSGKCSKENVDSKLSLDISKEKGKSIVSQSSSSSSSTSSSHSRSSSSHRRSLTSSVRVTTGSQMLQVEEMSKGSHSPSISSGSSLSKSLSDLLPVGTPNSSATDNKQLTFREHLRYLNEFPADLVKHDVGSCDISGKSLNELSKGDNGAKSESFLLRGGTFYGFAMKMVRVDDKITANLQWSRRAQHRMAGKTYLVVLKSDRASLPDRFVIIEGKLLKIGTNMYYPCTLYKDWKTIKFSATIIRITNDVVSSMRSDPHYSQSSSSPRGKIRESEQQTENVNDTTLKTSSTNSTMS
eukprot:GHVH01005634.1.p1 GENE.GHVH01005634.1~~GHVH01005634.1.p1  ORF type:complete len:524 (+),score=83.76 GHVH01005634.1:38-1609(+)